MAKVKINNNIKSNYDTYKVLVEGGKTILVSPIVVDQTKSNHKTIKEKVVQAKHESLEKDLEFVVQIKADDPTDFKFKLKCPAFDNSYFFRYDSAGACHRNSGLDVPIDQQRVPTPHFHKFMQTGEEIAYKTEVLKDQKQAEVLEDVSLCIAHFCTESNTKGNRYTRNRSAVTWNSAFCLRKRYRSFEWYKLLIDMKLKWIQVF